MILLDPEKITQLIVDVTNARHKDFLVDITKASITGKAVLTESELESVQNLTWAIHGSEYFRIWFPCTYIMQTLLRIYTNKLKRLRKQCIVPLINLYTQVLAQAYI